LDEQATYPSGEPADPALVENQPNVWMEQSFEPSYKSFAAMVVSAKIVARPPFLFLFSFCRLFPFSASRKHKIWAEVFSLEVSKTN
jgi:hypothetical protein